MQFTTGVVVAPIILNSELDILRGTSIVKQTIDDYVFNLTKLNHRVSHGKNGGIDTMKFLV